MQDSTYPTLLWLGVILAGLAVASLLAMIVLFWLGARWARATFDRWATPDPVALRLRMLQLRQRYSGLNDDALFQRIVAGEARKAGLVGALTGLGGLATLPIAIPVDFALSARIQTALVHFVAGLYAPDEPVEALKLQTYAIMAGSTLTRQAIEASSRAAQAAVRRILFRLLAETAAESLLKIVPVIGAVVGFALNYAATRAIGRLAVSRYRNRLPAPSVPLPGAAHRRE
jgi:hypothetical protein